MKKNITRRLAYLFVFSVLLTGAASVSAADAPALTSEQSAAVQNLTPAQQGAVLQELGKTGGQLTPGAVDALSGRPEFQGLSPAEVSKGKELLQQQEAAKQDEAKKEAKKPKEPDNSAEKPKDTLKKVDEPEAKAPAVKRTIGDLPRGETLFERAQATGKYQDISLDLKPFGYDFFRDAAIKVVTDSKNIPIPLKYIVGPGDEIRITMWGRANANYNLTVDRDGKISIPTIGPLAVAGMTFEQMSGYLIKQAEQITGTNVDISMGSLRTMQVFILGDVRRPGAYTIGSFATITDALLMAGGPTEIGSMRNIQLKRKDKVIQTFDLYDLLLKGDKSHDVIMQAGDIVFVPVIGPYVGVAGNVKRPALYELKKNFSLEYLFELAGGIIPTAYTQQIQIERTIKNEKKIVIDIDDKSLAQTKSITLQDADLIKIFSIVDKDVNVVYLNGNVKKGGKYALTPGMRIRDILRDETELLPETHFNYALIKRFQSQGKETKLIPFNLGDLLLKHDPAANLELQAQDSIYIFSKWFFQDKPTFTISGEVRKSGQFDLAENFKVKDAILTAGDLTKNAYLKKGEIVRVNKKKEYQTIYFDVAKALADDPDENILIRDEDGIIIHSLYEEKWKEAVEIAGEVKNPGEYQLTEKLRVSDLIFKAGGQTRNTLLDEAELYRTDWKTKEVTLQKINLRKALQNDIGDNLELKDLDRLIVHSIWETVFKKNVSVVGEVKKPGTYEFGEKMTVRDLVFAAGGQTQETLLDEAELYRTDWKTKEVTLKKVNLGKALNKEPTDNVELRDLDRLIVHSIWEKAYKLNVTVAGEVKKPGTYEFGETMTVRDLVFTAGGQTRDTLLTEAELYRTDWKTKEVTLKTINLDMALKGVAAHNLVLEDLDRLVVHSIWETVYKKSVTIEGDILKPGAYPLADNMMVRDLIFAAGNFLESASPEDGEISSQVIDQKNQAVIVHRKINLIKALAGDPEHNVILKPYDRLFIKRIPDWRPENYVTLGGEIMFPGRYLIKKGEKLSALIERAGGFKEEAYLRGAMFTRVRVRELQQQGLIDMADRMERELLSASAGDVSTAISTEEVEAKKVELLQKQKFIESLRKLKATGRMTIYLTHQRLLKGKENDIALEEGDSLFVPQKNNVVNVAGAVMAQGTYLYSYKQDYDDYINQTGGYSRYADKDNVFVMKVDGSARKLSRSFFDFGSSHTVTTQFGERIRAIEPGDIIVVPEKTERIAWLREIRDITQILMNIAVAAGVAINLF